MQRSFKYIISFIIIFSLCIVLPFSSLAADSFQFEGGPMRLLMGLDNYYYLYYSLSYSGNVQSLAAQPPLGYFEQNISGNTLYGNRSDFYVTNWNIWNNYSVVEFRIPFMLGNYGYSSSHSVSGSAQFVYNISSLYAAEYMDYTEHYSIDSVYFKGSKFINNQIDSNYQFNVSYSVIPGLVNDFVYDPLGGFHNGNWQFINLDWYFDNEVTYGDVSSVYDRINMDYLYIRIKYYVPYEYIPVGTICTSYFGFTNISIYGDEVYQSNIIVNLENLQLKFDTITAAVNNNFSALFELLENADTSEQLQIIQQTIQEVNGEWSEADEELYEAYVEETKQTTDRMEQMGDILNSVPKPPTQNITQVIKPSDTLVDTDIDGALTALNVIYNWKTFGTIIALVVALMTISYVIFGKKK